MKIWTMLAVLAIVFIVGCAAPADEPTTTEPVATEPVVEEPVVEEPVVVEPVVEKPEEVTSGELSDRDLSESDLAAIERYKTACAKGNVGLCSALKSNYGIIMTPEEAAADLADE